MSRALTTLHQQRAALVGVPPLPAPARPGGAGIAASGPGARPHRPARRAPTARPRGRHPGRRERRRALPRSDGAEVRARPGHPADPGADDQHPGDEDGAGTKTYDLEHRVATQQILPAPFPATEVWAYNGIVPGPTIRQQRGGALTFVRNKNSLPAGHPYSMHLHGSPSQPFFDGHPDDLTPVGATKTYKYPNSQEARTLWYHDHAIHQTAEHVYKGLAGFFIHDPSAADVTKYGLDALPSGKYDVPLMVGDMQFRTDGTVAYDDKGHDSLWGNVNVVNGRAWPKMHVDRTRYRFRMLVGSVSRSYNFALSNGAPITMIGTDAGLLPAPVQVSSFDTAWPSATTS
jgi:FtsP/CotA-like multicopper oxidase with cupredoxin domain